MGRYVRCWGYNGKQNKALASQGDIQTHEAMIEISITANI